MGDSRLLADLDSYLAHLAVERGLSSNTTSAYRRDLTRYANYLSDVGQQSLKTVSEADVEAYVQAIRLGSDGGAALSAASTARAIAAVRGWHKFEVAEGHTDADPAGTVRPPSKPQRLPKALSVDDTVRLIEAAGLGDGPQALRDRALVELLYGTGARISEAIALDVDDVDMDPERPSIRLFGKGNKERVVPVGSYAVREIEAYLVRGRPELASRGKGTPAVFVNFRGGRLSRQSAWTVLQKAAETAGLSAHVSPHTLRHSYATHLLAGGADVRIVQDLLGHASVTTTQIYTMVTPETLREVYASAHPRGL